MGRNPFKMGIFSNKSNPSVVKLIQSALKLHHQCTRALLQLLPQTTTLLQMISVINVYAAPSELVQPSCVSKCSVHAMRCHVARTPATWMLIGRRPGSLEKAFLMLFTPARCESKETLCTRRWLTQGQLEGRGKNRESGGEKNAHCKQSPAIAMVLKSLTGSHMIVINRRAGKKNRKKGGNATNQQTSVSPESNSSVSECLMWEYCLFWSVLDHLTLENVRCACRGLLAASLRDFLTAIFNVEYQMEGGDSSH